MALEREESVENEETIIRQLLLQLDNTSIEQSTSEVEKRPNTEVLKLQDPPNLEEILGADEALITPTSHNVSVINAACQDILKKMEHQLLLLLKKNRKEQDVIQGFLTSNNKNSYFENGKKTCIKCVGYPYFKDTFGFQPPPNDDVLRKMKNNKILPIDFIKSYPIWNSNDAKKLINAIKKYDWSNLSSIDWMKISATDMEGKYSPSECKSKWTLHVHPMINKAKWTLKEMDQLKIISAKNNYQDWDKIAVELGTKRTGLQCCTQYHTHTFPTEGKWTAEEDEALQKLIEQYRIKDYIPWSKVVWNFKKRSLKQCQERYAYHLGKIKKGTFTMEEDFVIVYLASKLKNFGEVAKFLPGRVSTQIRSRYEYLVKLSMPEFTPEEDELLTKLMVQYPRNWGKISEHFKNRSRIQCRKRWAFLQKTIKLQDEIQSENENEESLNILLEKSTPNIRKSEIDAKHVKRNMIFLSKPAVTARKYPAAYKKLLDYHKYCHKFLFGPKPRISANSKELKSLTSKMVATMKTLSINYTSPLSSFDKPCLTNNTEFNNEDLKVLNAIGTDSPILESVELSQKIIPPNYMTLVALRTFILAWNDIKNLSSFYEDKTENANHGVHERILFSDAKKLFKSRMKSIFAFPLIFFNISPLEKEKPILKPKARKVAKPLSKLKRKQHAKLMSAAYRKKLKLISKQFEGSNDELIWEEEEEEEEEPVETNEITQKKTDSGSKKVASEGSSNKRLLSSKAENKEEMAPLKKRKTRKSNSSITD